MRQFLLEVNVLLEINICYIEISIQTACDLN